MLARKHIGDLGKRRPPRSAITVVRTVGTPKALAAFARPAVLLITVCGSWLFTFAS